ncbi:MAG: hypothetical protein CVV31_01400 [Methanomicrobiales archaeon HGW-Methanomicrobiales-2]|nr:MAG: hypothetical protein CVV31_01400 [Methanomicrobiales archaeon HGW-Methanomicrobiales-2]
MNFLLQFFVCSFRQGVSREITKCLGTVELKSRVRIVSLQVLLFFDVGMASHVAIKMISVSLEEFSQISHLSGSRCIRWNWTFWTDRQRATKPNLIVCG